MDKVKIRLEIRLLKNVKEIKMGSEELEHKAEGRKE